jgi:hypothetical protein
MGGGGKIFDGTHTHTHTYSQESQVDYIMQNLLLLNLNIGS